MKYLTLICDIKDSKNLKNREEVQYKIIDMLKKANIDFNKEIASPFIITVGDEWQGLLKYPCDYDAIINFFHKTLAKVDFYCGIGIGNVTIHNFELTVNQLDGPSFHMARAAIILAKDKQYSKVLIEG